MNKCVVCLGKLQKTMEAKNIIIQDKAIYFFAPLELSIDRCLIFALPLSNRIIVECLGE